MTEAAGDSEGPFEPEAVGYGRPPQHSRFRPGQSGNPRGRPKGKRNMASLLSDVLIQPVTITANGKRKRVSSETAMLLRLRERALGGDLKAVQMLLSLRAAHLPDAEVAVDHRSMSAEDIAILVGFGLIPPGEPDDDHA